MTAINSIQKTSKRSLTFNKSFVLSIALHVIVVFGVTITTYYKLPIFQDSPVINVKFANSNEECISEASSYFTLEPGDIISFGTTGKGTGKFPRGHKSLLIGENTGTIDISIENLGKLSNPIKHQAGGA